MKKLLFLLMLVVLQIDFLTASTFRNNNSIYIDNTIYDNLKSIGFDDDIYCILILIPMNITKTNLVI